MALNTVLLIAAGISTNIGVQDPGFDLQFALPALDQSPITGQQATPTAPTDFVVPPESIVWDQAPTYVTAGQSQRVSASFKSAKPTEVLAWLEKHGVSFVVGDGMIPPNATVTLNIVDQPVGDVADALATALGGHWSRRNNVRVFMPGPQYTVQGMPSMPVPMRGTTSPVTEMELSKQFGPEFQKRMEAMAKDMEKRFGPEFQKRMQETARQEIEIYMQGKDGKLEKRTIKPGEAIKLHDGAKIEIERIGELNRAKLEEMRVQGQKAPLTKDQIEKLKAEGKVKVFTSEQIEKLRAEGMAKVYTPEQVQKLRSEARAHGELAREMAKVRVLDGQRLREIETRIRANGERIHLREGQRAYLVDAKKFVSSLTPDQKHSMRTRGYVRYIDLSTEQRKMLGNRPNGKWEIKLKVDGQDVVVRGS